MKIELIFLEMAKNELEAAKYLFSKKLYSQSVFHLQQAIEKAVKCFGIWSKIITDSEAKDVIGHEAWKLYLKIFDEVKNKIARLEEVLNKFPSLKEVSLIKKLDIPGFKSKMQGYEHAFKFSDEEMFNLSFSKEKLQAITNEINKLNESLKEAVLPETIKEEELSDLRKEFHDFLDAISEFNPNINEKVKEKINEILTPLIISIFKMIKDTILRVISSSVSLFYLSIIFSPHAVKSRYPQNDFNPLEAYTDEMPLIQIFDSFIKVSEEVLEDLQSGLSKVMEK